MKPGNRATCKSACLKNREALNIFVLWCSFISIKNRSLKKRRDPNICNRSRLWALQEGLQETLPAVLFFLLGLALALAFTFALLLTLLLAALFLTQLLAARFLTQRLPNGTLRGWPLAEAAESGSPSASSGRCLIPGPLNRAFWGQLHIGKANSSEPFGPFRSPTGCPQIPG